MSEFKWKHFWITWKNGSNLAYTRHPGEKWSDDVNIDPSSVWTHVIEYAALTEKEEEIRELETLNEHLGDKIAYLKSTANGYADMAFTSAQDLQKANEEINQLNNYTIAGYEVMLSEMKGEITKLKADKEKLIEGLKFYADNGNWNLTDAQHCPAMVNGEDIEPNSQVKRMFYGGRIARKVLGEVEGEKK